MIDYTKLFSPTAVKVLLYFVNRKKHPGEFDSMNDIRQATHIDYSLLSQSLLLLTSYDILYSMYAGHSCFYKPNERSAFLINFKTLISGLEVDMANKRIGTWRL